MNMADNIGQIIKTDNEQTDNKDNDNARHIMNRQIIQADNKDR